MLARSQLLEVPAWTLDGCIKRRYLRETVVKIAKVSYLGVGVGIATFASLFLPWWSIRALGVSIDVYPFGVMAWNVPTYDYDWVVDRLLTLDGTLLIVGLLVFASGSLALAGSLALPPFLVAPVVLNLFAAFLFHGLMRSAIGKLAYGSFSGTNLIAAGPWGFAFGIGLCVLAGLTSLIPLILHYLKIKKLF